MKIGMIVAMDKELKQLRPLFPEDKVILQKSGIATVNAAIQTVEMIHQYKPDCIISTGCAGGNGDDINLQDVVVSTELTYHDVYCGKAIDETTVYGGFASTLSGRSLPAGESKVDRCEAWTHRYR